MQQARLGDRSLFPNLDCIAYLAHAAIAPLSSPVVAQVQKVLESYSRGGMAGFAACAPWLKATRKTLASLIDARPHEVAFVSNTTHGVIDIAFGVRWNTGDRILLFEEEFPANVTPWQQASREFDLDLRWLSLAPFHRSPEEGLEALDRELQAGLRLVAVSAVQYKTGLRMPVEAMATLCHQYGAELFVDAIQAAGATPISVQCGIDYLSTGSHKHLMGPEGAGLLYVSERCALPCLPRLAGWLSHEDAIDFLTGDEPRLRYDKPLKKGAEAFEIGTLNAMGFCALGASVDLLHQFERGAIHAHVNEYLDVLERGLVERGFESLRAGTLESRSTLLSVRTPKDVRPTRLASNLRKRGVICNTPDGLLRFAPHWANHLDEVSHLLDAFDESLAECRA